MKTPFNIGSVISLSEANDKKGVPLVDRSSTAEEEYARSWLAC